MNISFGIIWGFTFIFDFIFLINSMSSIPNDQKVPGQVSNDDVQNMKKYGQLHQNAPEKNETKSEFLEESLKKGREEADNVCNMVNH